MNELIKKVSLQAANSLMNVYNNGAKNTYSFKINCNELEDYNYIDIRTSPKYNSLFSDLNKMKGPCLYYFEIISAIPIADVINTFNDYTKTSNAKATPPLKNSWHESKILYVGKVKRNFTGRLVQHLGYYKVNETQGLQIYYWAKEIDLRLNITVFEFDHNMTDLMPILEYEFAKILKPLLGMHR